MDIRRCFNGEGKAKPKPRTHPIQKFPKKPIPQTFKQKYAKEKVKEWIEEKNKDQKPIGMVMEHTKTIQ